MTVSDIFNAFQQVNGGISGIKFAPNAANTPNQLTDGQLPAVVTWFTGEDWTKMGSMYWTIEVYVAPVGQANPTSAMATCLTLLDRFRTTYRGLSKIGLIPISREKGRGGFWTDGVHKTIHYAGKEYFGFSFHVPLMGNPG